MYTVLLKELMTKKTLLVIFDAFFSTKTSYQVVLRQKWKNPTAMLRDILSFSQAHALKCVMQLKVIKGKEIFLGRGSILLLCKKLIF